VPGAEDYIVEALQWLGINIDEGIVAAKEGPHALSPKRTQSYIP
jgi:glutamyl-tRNA synthetase